MRPVQRLVPPTRRPINGSASPYLSVEPRLHAQTPTHYGKRWIARQASWISKCRGTLNCSRLVKRTEPESLSLPDIELSLDLVPWNSVPPSSAKASVSTLPARASLSSALLTSTVRMACRLHAPHRPRFPVQQPQHAVPPWLADNSSPRHCPIALLSFAASGLSAFVLWRDFGLPRFRRPQRPRCRLSPCTTPTPLCFNPQRWVALALHPVRH
jgi:hypothetical protein